MLEGTLSIPAAVEDEEEVQGTYEFSWTEIVLGIFAGGREFSDKVNKAIEEAYNL